MERNDKILFAALGAGILVIGWMIRSQNPYTGKQAKYATPTDSPHRYYDDSIFPYEHGEHFVPPKDLESAVFMPLRYPPRPGHELTCLIESGYEPLFRPRDELAGWLANPPSEQG